MKDAAIERCHQHGLVLGPDGMCVLCRREAQSGWTRRIWAFVAAVVIAGCGLAAGAWLWTAKKDRDHDRMVAMVRATAVHPWIDLPMPHEASPPTVAQGTRRFHFPPADPALPPTRPAPETAAPAEPAPAPAADRNRRAQEAMREVSITIFTADWCTACQQAKAWLRQHDIPYKERNIESHESARNELRRINPGGKIPTLLIDGAVVSGFSASGLETSIRRAAEARVARAD